MLYILNWQNTNASEVSLDYLEELLQTRITKSEIARRLSISRPTLYKLMKENNLLQDYR